MFDTGQGLDKWQDAPWKILLLKPILRVYIIKYSNLGTIIASSIRWSVAASKMECGRPRCNWLDALARSNLAMQCPSWGKSPPLTAAYPVNVSPWLCFYLSTLYPFLACNCASCSPASRPVIHSPQSVLLLLSCSLPSSRLLFWVLESLL
jgi:hypothetical protein